MVIAISAARNANPIGQGRPLARIATRLSGVAISAVFYLIVYLVPFSPAKRYFLGHPVAVAATILFWIAAVSLFAKWLSIRRERRLCEQISDSVLAPTLPTDAAHPHHDVRSICQSWSDSLTQLPAAARSSRLVRRLEELLQRQVRRGNARQLADDLREVAGRDADAAHDSFGLVRIIVWAIPMLGFLGTVIGITQTLGGLDFTDGTAAVDRLKSGLYVAFDTTALGLVLSVVAIFLQFPVERREQRLLAAIDARVAPMLFGGLPSQEAADNQTNLIVNLCEGIRVAVAESLASQTQLWRQTIDEAHQHWQSVHETDANQFSDAITMSLAPALKEHVAALDKSVKQAGDRLQRSAQDWQGSFESSLDRLLAAQQAGLASQKQITVLQQELVDRSDELFAAGDQTQALQAAQASLDANLIRLAEVNQSVAESIDASAGDGMADAMRVLARAVDMLSAKMNRG